MRTWLILIACTLASACNLSDDLTYQAPICVRDTDCNDHGDCILVNQRQVCQCNAFFDGTNCDSCVPGRVLVGDACVPDNNSTNNSTTNNTTTTNSTTNNSTTSTNNNTTPMCPTTQVACGTECCAIDQSCGANGCEDVFVGRRCMADAECGPNGVCITQAASRILGGYCTVACSSGSDCPPESTCSELAGACVRLCGAGGTCTRTELECGHEADEPEACWPSGVGNAPVGAACNTVAVCMGGVAGRCLAWPGGYCSQTCTLPSDCPTDTHCSGVCLNDCTTNADCRAPQYGCVDEEFDGVLECAPRALGTGAVGAACVHSGECAGDQFGRCLNGNGLGDGSCVLLCGPGQASCPAGSVCSDMGFAQVCRQGCMSAADCRPGFSCLADPAGNFLCTAP